MNEGTSRVVIVTRVRLYREGLTRMLADPCPCGSGKKLKRCCGVASGGVDQVASVESGPESGPDRERRRSQAVWPKAQRTLLEHMVEWVGEKRARGALDQFELPEGVQPGHLDAWMAVLISWSFHDWMPKGKTQTVAAHFLADSRRGPHDVDVVSLIRATNDEALSFYLVEAVERGHGVGLRELFTGEKRFVSDKSFSESARPWAVVFARLAAFGEVTIFDAVGPRPLGPEWADEIVADVEEELGWKLPTTRATVRAHATLLIAEYFDAVEAEDARHAELPELYTTDGERIVFCTDIWTVLEKREELPAIFEKLGLEAADEGVFLWSRDDDNDGRTSTLLGRVVLEGDELRLETNSRERRKRMKARLARALGKRAEHVNFEERQVEEEMRRPRLVPNEPPARPSPAETEAVRAWVAAHYAAWPDTPLPAFEGRTPRSMMKTKRGRAEGEALIREMEYRSHGSPMEGAYDFGLLRRELGLSAR